MEFDIQLIDSVVSDMNDGKAAGLDGLSAEHLKYSHPIVINILCKLFNLFIHTGYLPSSFGASCTVRIPKLDSRLQALSVNDFQGISIRSVVSKVCDEHMVTYKPFPWAITCGTPGICPGRSPAYAPAIGWPSHHVITRSC